MQETITLAVLHFLMSASGSAFRGKHVLIDEAVELACARLLIVCRDMTAFLILTV